MVKRIAVSSIIMALSVVCLFVGSIWPVKIAMCLMASALTTIAVIECGHKYAWLTFFGAAIISFLVIPKKFIVYFYIFFLGYYPIIKLYIERINRLFPEWIIKLILFNIGLIIAYFSLNRFLLPSLDRELVMFVFKYLAALIATSEVIFVVYDLGLSYIINFYNQRLRRNIKL